LNCWGSGSQISHVINLIIAFKDNKNGSTDSKIDKNESSKLIKNLSLRADVIKKTILRSFKQHYHTEFKKYCKETGTKNFKDNPSLVFIKSQEFIVKNFGVTDDGKLSQCLVAIIDTKNKFSNSDPYFDETRVLVLDTIRKFNQNKFSNLLNLQEFWILLNKFLMSPIEHISRNKTSREVVEAYSLTMQELRYKCDQLLKKQNRQIDFATMPMST